MNKEIQNCIAHMNDAKRKGVIDEATYQRYVEGCGGGIRH